MVISQEIIERAMGYRGSKSTTGIINYIGTTEINKNMFVVVKEQRVDGGYIGDSSKNIKYTMLRCTLTGFERSYQVKILSNQISFTGIRHYSTNCVTAANMQLEN